MFRLRNLPLLIVIAAWLGLLAWSAIGDTHGATLSNYPALNPATCAADAQLLTYPVLDLKRKRLPDEWNTPVAYHPASQCGYCYICDVVYNYTTRRL